ncbi:hypothetical protein [Treponema sp.]|uniref:hypothetical protein n=1 Tax=Treponema sp. TaxID=166 RepID=UPI00257E04A2|nr:hypothetical protein [Treponema sp.]MBE6355439.1 hypothetical protein [Treponema sp.]
MKKRISLFTGVLAVLTVLAFSACSFGVKESKSSSTDGIEIGEIFEKNGEKFVTITMNSSNSIIQNARTILPDSPELYFSVTASTAEYAAATETTLAGTLSNAVATGANLSTTNVLIENEADCSYATSTAASTGYVADPYYGNTVNKMDGITLTLKVGYAYNFTVYATAVPAGAGAKDVNGALITPEPESMSNLLFSTDVTGNTTYSDYSSPAISGVGKTKADTINGSSTSNDEIHYAVRQILVEHLAMNAIVKGHSYYYIGQDGNGNATIYKGTDLSVNDTDPAGLSDSVTIAASSDGITGTGTAYIPVYLEATDALTEGLAVRKIKFAWTNRGGDTSKDGSFEFEVKGDTTLKNNVTGWFALNPTIQVGEYDTDFILLGNPNDDGEFEDIFTIHDTLIVWKNQESVLLGKGSYYTAYDHATNKPTGLSHNGTSFGAPPTDTKAAIGYKITAENIKRYFRTVFYVTGDQKLITADANAADRTGSILHPFASVQEALDAITGTTGKYGLKNGYGSSTTDWNIIVDEVETTPTPVSYEYTAADADSRDFNLTIRKYNGASTDVSTLTEGFTLTNTSGQTVNLTMTNILYNGGGTAADYAVTNTTGSVVADLHTVGWTEADSSSVTFLDASADAGTLKVYGDKLTWSAAADTGVFTLSGDLYLINSHVGTSAASRGLTTVPAASAGKVVLYADYTGYTDGLIYADPDALMDTGKYAITVMNISNFNNADPGDGDGGVYDKPVVSWDYKNKADDYGAITATSYVPVDFTKSFVLSDAFVDGDKAQYDSDGDTVADANLWKRKLVAYRGDSDGKIYVMAENQNINIGFEENALHVEQVVPNADVELKASEISAATPTNNTFTIKLKVTSTSPALSPANGAAVLEKLKSSVLFADDTTANASGTLKIIFGSNQASSPTGSVITDGYDTDTTRSQFKTFVTAADTVASATDENGAAFTNDTSTAYYDIVITVQPTVGYDLGANDYQTYYVQWYASLSTNANAVFTNITAINIENDL